MLVATLIKAGNPDLGPLIDICREIDIQELLVMDKVVADRALDIQQPDLVIGYLDPPSDITQFIATADLDLENVTALTNLEVMLQLGRAVERRIPACLIVPPPLRAPSVPSQLVVIPCQLSDVDSLRLHLWAFTANLAERRQDTATAPAQISPPVDFKRYIRLLKSLRQKEGSNIPSFRVEQLVVELIRATGVAFAENPEKSMPDRGFDMAVLPSRESDEIALIEVLAGHLNERRLHDSELRLQEATLDRRAQLGVLLYDSIDGRRFPAKRTTPLVLRLALEDLIEQLGHKSLSEVLTEEVAKATERI
ncbi:hypothetical protein ACFFWA_27010 [Actinomadura verrucosospora]|uniref:hypothetical protein n=2 Tax=Actinomadura verrucosospora TaxID=46165 RepID=UPI0031F074E4